MKKIFKRLFASALIAVCALTAIPVYAAAQTEEVRAVYLGVLDYGTETSANKDNFIHRFYADGEGKTTAAGENHVTVGGKAFSFTEIYEISN